MWQPTRVGPTQNLPAGAATFVFTRGALNFASPAQPSHQRKGRYTPVGRHGVAFARAYCPGYTALNWWSFADFPIEKEYNGLADKNPTRTGAFTNRGEQMESQVIARNLACVEKHFHSEAVNEVEAALDLYTDDIVWEAPALNGLDRRFSGKAAVEKNYRELFASMRDVRFEPLQRFATEDRVVDDSLVTFEIARYGYWPWALNEKIEMRLVHIFEMQGGKISREIVFDMGRPVAG